MVTIIDAGARGVVVLDGGEVQRHAIDAKGYDVIQTVWIDVMPVGLMPPQIRGLRQRE